jgi:hypothetical protein
VGRFLGRDPAQERGGINVYEFVGNEPLNGYDIFGLWKVKTTPRYIKSKIEKSFCRIENDLQNLSEEIEIGRVLANRLSDRCPVKKRLLAELNFYYAINNMMLEDLQSDRSIRITIGVSLDRNLGGYITRYNGVWDGKVHLNAASHSYDEDIDTLIVHELSHVSALTLDFGDAGEYLAYANNASRVENYKNEWYKRLQFFAFEAVGDKYEDRQQYYDLFVAGCCLIDGKEWGEMMHEKVTP